ncbi:MAG: D-glycero-beta-D-manno-heptose-7-phosphate kinase [Bacteroidia bacterium]|nr:D-glycero-beta-D-manno-heptose-7-phosphate kinase [Bacteroidia bacterium]
MNIPQLLKSFKKQNVLIIGDVMLDAYVFGKVDRISPEAPVPVLHVRGEDTRLGGAANVALNVQALGAKPVLCSVIGKDAHTNTLIGLLKKQNMSRDGMVISDKRICTVKTRMIGNNHQLLRVDTEETAGLNKQDRAALIAKIKTLIVKADVVIFEDYDKGVIDEEVIKATVKAAAKRKIPVVVDPKKVNFLNYTGVTLFKPNLKELKEGLKLDTDLSNDKNLSDAVLKLQKLLNAKMVMVTLSEKGVVITEGNKLIREPAHVRNIADVSGAGDTVVSVAALTLATGCTPQQVAALSNLAGGLVCEEVGVVPVNIKQFAEEAARLAI